jgi:serine/threonine-protein kinase
VPPEKAEKQGGDAQSSRRRIAGFEIAAKLGQGGMGAVFKAVQLSVKRPVALKILPPRLAKNAEFVQRFFREAQSAAQLNHPNIVQAYDAGEADGYHYFAMEFVDGRPVSDFLQEGNPLPEDQALTLVRDVALALDYAHESGILHRDIKPANILLTSQGKPKLADLGLAREAASTSSDLTQAGFAIGTPDYISPEQVRGDTGIDGRTDIYSLGATLFHMLTGRPPYAGGTGNEVMAKHLADPIPDARKLNPDVSRGAARIVWRAMAKDPARRFQTGGEMAAEIDRVLSAPERGVGAESAARRQRAQAPKGPSGLVVGSVIAAILLAAVGIAVLASGPGDENGNGGTGNGNGGARTTSGGTGTHISRKPQSEIDAEALAALRRLPRATGDQIVDTIRQYEDARRLIKTPAVMVAANSDLTELRKKLDERAGRLFEERSAEAARLASTGDYPAALKQFEGLPRWAAPELRSRIAAETARLKSEAERTIRAALAAGDEAIRAHKPDDGLAALDRIADVKYPPLADEVAAMRKKLEALRSVLKGSDQERALALARAGVERLIEQIEAAAAAEGFEEAGRLADAALKDRTLQPDAERLKKVAAIGRIIGSVPAKENVRLIQELKSRIGRIGQAVRTKEGTRTGEIKEVSDKGVVLDPTPYINGVRQKQKPLVTIKLSSLDEKTRNRWRVPWEPGTPDESIAATIVALGRRNLKRMAEVLKGAKGHFLYPRYVRKLRELSRKEIEIVVDNSDKKRFRTLRGNSWRLDALFSVPPDIVPYGDSHATTKEAGRVSAEWRFVLPPGTGDLRVQAWYLSDRPEVRSDQILYQIETAPGEFQRVGPVSQKPKGSGWVDLGTHRFAGGGERSIVLTVKNNKDGVFVVADAMRLAGTWNPIGLDE